MGKAMLSSMPQSFDQRQKVLRILHDHGGNTAHAVEHTAEVTGVPEAEVYGAATFYTLLVEHHVTRVCKGLSCQIAGADEYADRLHTMGHEIRRVSCIGQCNHAPAGLTKDLEVLTRGKRGDFSKLGPGDTPPDTSDVPDTAEPKVSTPTNTPGTLSALTAASRATPLNLAHDIATKHNAASRFASILRTAHTLGRATVFDRIEASGLQGRGGAGFSAHIKWRAVAGHARGGRVLICNADEAEPGTFKDRTLMEKTPLRVLAGIAVAAWAIRATRVVIYVRGEFQAAQRSIANALPMAEAALHAQLHHERTIENETHAAHNETQGGHLTSETPARSICFELVSGHGAYICGEETALLESIEGKRGMPRLKPPFPTDCGLLGLPTLIHNVETLACIPFIIEHGAQSFRNFGITEPGTKLYCISGHVQRPGVYELGLGANLNELVDAAGGYVGTPWAFSPGGASSGFLPIHLHTLPLDFSSLAQHHSLLGSAGVVVLNDTVDLRAAVRTQLDFFADESCGQCAPCRLGTRYMHQALLRALECAGKDTLSSITDVAWEMREGSICGLGMVAAQPLMSALKYFPEVFSGLFTTTQVDA